jgi:hypothetical protein
LDIDKLVADLKKERDRLARTIEALIGMGGAGRAKRKGRKPGTKMASTRQKRRGGITPAGRKRLSIMMKKRWAERRKKGNG